MVLDKFLGVRAMEDWLAYASDFVDVVKFGWGTARVLPEAVLRDKLALLRNAGVKSCPGGTFMELAYLHRAVEPVLAEARELGFDCIEISDGTVDIPYADKLSLIRQARDMGFEVFSEVGKKSPFADQRLSFAERVEAVRRERDAGAAKVIIEAREAGTTGIFGSSGRVIPEYVENLVSHVGLDEIMFEAPQAKQQLWLIEHLGNDVNIGNVPPDGALNLETLRLGLRSDTLLRYHASPIVVHLENGVAGAERAAARGDVCIVVDALRASSTIITALANGMGSVRTVATPEECVGELTAGERYGEKLPGVDFDNSPLAFVDGGFHGQELVLNTTNGTACIDACSKGANAILIGSLINASAVGARARELGLFKGVSLVMAGRRGGLAPEDLVAASAIVEALGDCEVRGQFKPLHSENPKAEFLASGSGENLKRLGREDDVHFCAELDRFATVPEWADGRFVSV